MKVKGRLMILSHDEQVLLWEAYQRLVKQTRILELDNYIQHGEITTLKHSIAVAYFSVLLIKRLHIKCNEKSLIIGALFHDYFLYDWHVKDKSHRLHGFFHPKTAYENAKRDYEINQIESNIILRHMFPLTFIPPRYREAVIVSLVDKICSTYETFSKHPYEKLMIEIKDKIYHDIMINKIDNE